jgi:hypothetical protein
MTAIPPRQPIHDSVQGSVVRLGDAELLVVAEMDAAVNAEALLNGTLIVRYGVRYLGKPHLSIVPGLLALDYGEFMTGESAWEFLLHRSNLYPRAEVFGYRNDGADESLFIRQLDLALAPEVLVYEDKQATAPTARPLVLIAPDSAILPERLRASLPQYAALADYLKATHD